jgi:hypothetical protein
MQGVLTSLQSLFLGSLLLALVACGGEPAPEVRSTPAGDGTTTPTSATTSVSVAEASLIDADAITRALSEHVIFLSSDELEGRSPGSLGSAAARRYIIERMTAAGVEPLFGDSHAQRFEHGMASAGINVAGVIPGALAPPRYLVVSAHYDHLGHAGDEVFNGADDNASGVAVLLELGETLEAGELTHTLLLIAFDGEEQGLAGSRAFVERPPVPLGRIDGIVNLDMVGRADGRGIWVAGTRQTPALVPLVQTAASGLELPVLLGHDGAQGHEDWTLSSDHGPFHERGIHFLYLGVENHADYHRPTDDWHQIDFRSLREVLELARRLVVALDVATPLPQRQ